MSIPQAKGVFDCKFSLKYSFLIDKKLWNRYNNGIQNTIRRNPLC